MGTGQVWQLGVIFEIFYNTVIVGGKKIMAIFSFLNFSLIFNFLRVCPPPQV